jgi:hypothetical protein
VKMGSNIARKEHIAFSKVCKKLSFVQDIYT